MLKPSGPEDLSVGILEITLSMSSFRNGSSRNSKFSVTDKSLARLKCILVNLMDCSVELGRLFSLATSHFDSLSMMVVVNDLAAPPFSRRRV